jgi:hypothetical protein
MPKVQAWQCKHTGKLFPIEQEKEYKRHTGRAYRTIAAQKKEARERAEFNEWLATEKLKCKTLDQVAEFLTKNFNRLNTYNYGYRNGKKPIIVSIKITGEYRDRVSNTHSCPRNGVTNWGSKADKPKGYPGIYGRIEIKVQNKDNYSGFLSDYLGPADVHTGSGGHGDYDVTLWLDDWPGLKETVEKQIAEYNEQHVVNILAGKKSPIFKVDWSKA